HARVSPPLLDGGIGGDPRGGRGGVSIPDIATRRGRFRASGLTSVDPGRKGARYGTTTTARATHLELPTDPGRGHPAMVAPGSVGARRRGPHGRGRLPARGRGGADRIPRRDDRRVPADASTVSPRRAHRDRSRRDGAGELRRRGTVVGLLAAVARHALKHRLPRATEAGGDLGVAVSSVVAGDPGTV